MRYLEIGGREGKIMLGGDRPDLPAPFNEGYFLNPTIIVDAAADCTVNQEEIFGPVVTIVPFDEEDEAVALANDVKYGLSAVVQTQQYGPRRKGLRARLTWARSGSTTGSSAICGCPSAA